MCLIKFLYFAYAFPREEHSRIPAYQLKRVFIAGEQVSRLVFFIRHSRKSSEYVVSLAPRLFQYGYPKLRESFFQNRKLAQKLRIRLSPSGFIFVKQQMSERRLFSVERNGNMRRLIFFDYAEKHIHKAVHSSCRLTV